MTDIANLERFGAIWRPEEDELIRKGLPVPNRTKRAIKLRRMKLKINKPEPVKLADPYRPMNRREAPAWWKRALRLNASGLGSQAIATIMGRHVDSVRHVLRESRRARNRRVRPQGERQPRDNKRAMIRAAARDQWEADGKEKPLSTYYARFECE